MHHSFFTNLSDHVSLILSGATGVGLIAHAVNTFPTPTNKYGAWFLGLVQWIVGQRVAAANTFKGQDTESFAKPKEPGA